jgi:mRNA-degrading endonuclease RelE of RelBE toxin-antitoxin system
MIIARPGRFPYGSPGLRRLRVGRYRVLYEISGDVVSIGHIARGTASG